MIILENRFKQVHFEKLPGREGANRIEILQDQETGILYCIAGYGGNITMTPLLDSGGKPLVDTSE